MLSAMTTVFGSAIPCRRAARFGVSPTTACSCAAPDPIRSPTTTSPVAIPTRVCREALRLQAADRSDHLQSRPYRSLGVVLMGLRVAEIHEHAVAHVLRYEPAEAMHGLGDTFLVGRNDIAQVLRIHSRRECRRTDEVREHHGELAALGSVLWCGGRCSRNGCVRSILVAAREFGYRPQQLTAMTERNPDLLKVLIGEIGENGKADVILRKLLRVLCETKLLQPIR